MRKVICTILLLVFWALAPVSCAVNESQPVSSAVNELQLEDYATIVTECNTALYSIMRYVLVDANEADSAKLKSLAPSFSKLVSNFGKKLAKLQSVTLAQLQYRPYHRLFVKDYAELYRWSKKTSSVFRAGDSDKLTQQVILAKYMLRNLSDILRAFTEADINSDLIEAAWGADTAKVKQLVKQGADLNAKDSAGQTILMFAALSGHAKAVKALIDAGADVNAKNKFDWTALMSAEVHGYTNTAKALIDAGAKASNSYNALLVQAAQAGDTAKVKQLIKQGADVNAKNSIGKTILMFAALSGHAKAVKALIDAGADVNAKKEYDDTALMDAASYGHTDTVKALIDAGADVNAKDEDGETVLMGAASWFGNLDIVRLLKQAGAKGQTVSEEARRHMIRGQAAVETAKSPADYEAAIREFEQAAKLAPDRPEIWYNLGMVQKEADKYWEAIGNLKKYLALAPNAKDAGAVRDLIDKIEFLKERRLNR